MNTLMVFSKKESLKVKGIAILLLLFHHMYLNKSLVSSSGVRLLFLSESQLIAIAASARVCVWLFAFLSAYGLSLQYKPIYESNPEKTLYFYCRRLWKLLLPYQTYLVFFWIISFFIFPSHTIFDQYNGNVLLYAIGDFFALNDLLNFPKFSGVFWYMSFAMIEVLLVPAIYDIVKRINIGVIPLTLILIKLTNTSSISSPQGGSYLAYMLIIESAILFAQMDLFAKIASLMNSIKTNKKIVCFLVLFLLRIICMKINGMNKLVDYTLIRWIFATISAIAIILFSFLFLRCKWLESMFMFLGRYSLFMFLVHIVIVRRFVPFVFFSKNVIISWMICLIASLLFSISFSFVINQMNLNRLMEIKLFK